MKHRQCALALCLALTGSLAGVAPAAAQRPASRPNRPAPRYQWAAPPTAKADDPREDYVEFRLIAVAGKVFGTARVEGY
jgi:hypothetical protein